MNALTIHPSVYVLKLEDECYYIGITFNLNLRMAQHWSSQGAKWTKLHKPVSIVEVIYPATVENENEITLKYMKLFGKDLVRGGNWCQV
jgi:predicted GIY-YIG superfamily endonuclease